MAEAASVHVTLSADTQDFTRAIEKAADDIKSSFLPSLVSAELIADGIKAIGESLVGFAKGAFDHLAEVQEISAQTAAGIRSTGGAANITAEEIANLANALEEAHGVSGEMIQRGENLLLTFTNIRNGAGAGNDIFNQTTKIMADLSVKMGTDATSAAMMLGKALNDPTKGIGALSKAGVQLSETQREQVKAFQDSGRIMDAQKIILKELETQVGGAAEAYGKTWPGAIGKAEAAMEGLGDVLFGDVMPGIQEMVSLFTEGVKAMTAAIEDKGLINGIMSVFGPEVKAMVLGIAVAVTAAVVPAIIEMGTAAIAAGAATVAAWLPILGLAAAIAFAATPIIKYWDDLAFEFGQVFDFVSARVTDFANWVKTAFNHIANAVVGPVVRWIQDKLAGLWNALPSQAQDALKAVGVTFGAVGNVAIGGIQAVALAHVGAAKFVAGAFQESFSGWGDGIKAAQAVMDRFAKAVPVDFAKMAGDLHKQLGGGGGAGGALDNLSKAAKKTADEAKKHAEQITKSFDDMGSKLKGIDLAGALNGESDLDTVPKKIDAILGGLKHLVEMGVSPADKRFQAFAVTLRALQVEMEALGNGQTAIKAFSGNVSVLTALNHQLQDVRERAALFGAEIDVNRESADAYRKAVDTLRLTLGATNPIVLQLVDRYQELSAAAQDLKFESTAVDKIMADLSDGLIAADTKAKRLGKSFDLNVEVTKLYNEALANLAGEGGQQAQEAFDSVNQALGELPPAQVTASAALSAFQQSATEVGSAVNGLRDGLTTMATTLGINVNNAFLAGFTQAGNFALAIVQVGASIAPLMGAVSGLMTQLPVLLTSIGGTAAGFLAAVPGVNLVAAAIAGVVAISVAMASSWDQLIALAEDIAWALPPIGLALAAVKASIETVISAGQWLVAGLKAVGTTVRNVFHDLANVVKASVNHVVRAVNTIVDGINNMSEHIGFTLPRMQELTVETFEQAEAHREAAKAAQAQAKAVADLTASLNESLRSGVTSAMGSAIKGFLDGTRDLTEGLRDGIKNAIISGITDAVMQTALIKGALGGLLEQLSSGLASGRDVTGIVSQIGSQIPGLARQLESTLAPLRDAVMSAFPSAPKATTAASGGGSSSNGKSNQDLWAEAYTNFAKNQQGAERWTFDQFFNAMGGRLPGLANGGLVSSATLALVGEGPNPEAVVPLSQSVFSKLASGIVGQMPAPAYAGGGGDTYIEFNIRVDDREAGERLVKELRRLGIRPN